MRTGWKHGLTYSHGLDGCRSSATRPRTVGVRLLIGPAFGLIFGRSTTSGALSLSNQRPPACCVHVLNAACISPSCSYQRRRPPGILWRPAGFGASGPNELFMVRLLRRSQPDSSPLSFNSSPVLLVTERAAYCSLHRCVVSPSLLHQDGADVAVGRGIEDAAGEAEP